MSRREDVASSSERGLGYVFAAVFLLLAALQLWHGSRFAYGWLTLSAAFAAAGTVRPGALAPLNWVGSGSACCCTAWLRPSSWEF